MAGNKGFGGGIFQSTDIGELRRARREGLLGQALEGVRSSQGRLGATLGTLFGDGLRQAIHGDPPEIQRARVVKEVQSWAAENGLNAAKDPDAFFTGVAAKFEELGMPDLAKQTVLQGIQFKNMLLPSQQFNFTKEQAAIKNERADEELELNRSAHELQRKEAYAVNVALPNGERVRGRKNKTGEVEISDGRGGWTMAPAGAQVISTSLQGNKEDIGVTSKEQRGFRELEARIPYLERLRARIKKGLESGNFVGGVSGDTLTMFNSLRSQVQQVRQQLGKDDVSLDLDKHRDALGAVANMNSQVQAGIIDLAYLTAKLLKPGDRITDQDLKAELKTFAANTSDPSIIMQRVNDKIGDILNVYGNTASILGVSPRYSLKEEQRQEQPPAKAQTPSNNVVDWNDL